MSGEQEQGLRLGEHQITFEQPHVFVLRLQGDISVADVEHIFTELQRVAAGAEQLYWLTDISGVGAIGSAARRRAASPPEVPQLRGSVLCGGNLLQRMAVTLSINAARLMRRGRPGRPSAFLTTEAEARAWIAERLAEDTAAARKSAS